MLELFKSIILGREVLFFALGAQVFLEGFVKISFFEVLGAFYVPSVRYRSIFRLVKLVFALLGTTELGHFIDIISVSGSRSALSSQGTDHKNNHDRAREIAGHWQG